MARAGLIQSQELLPGLPHRCRGAQDVRVQVLPEVRGQLGGTVELPCHLLSPAPGVRVSQVTWKHRDVTVAAFHPKYGVHFPNPQLGQERLSFVNAGAGQGTETDLRDATLALRGLRVEDEGNYTCDFTTFPNGTRREVTWLRVIAQPQNHAEAQEVTLSLEPVPVARCVSSGGRPPARVSWVSSLDGEARETQAPGTLPGTVTVTSRLTLVPLGRTDGVKVSCKVEHETFREPVLLPVTLSVRCEDRRALTCARTPRTSGVFPAAAVVQGPQLLIHTVDSLVNTTFICTVTNAVGTGRAEQLVLVRDSPRASPQDMGPLVWGAVGGTLLVLLLLAGGSLAYILLRGRRRRKSPGEGAGGDAGAYDAKSQVLGNGGPVFWPPAAPGPLRPEGKGEEEEEEEEEEEKAEEGLMLPRPPALEDDMESQLDGSLISRRAVYV
uniref:Nectin cell adhesion molecule 2 n=1 Tax=Oryctolagus cuniculus TaxID=9986 RepID=A0A5F9CHF7_RABIT